MAADRYAGLVRAQENPGATHRRQEPVKANVAVGRGYLTCLNAGYVDLPSPGNAALKCNGVSMDNVDATGLANGDLSCGTEDGVFDFENDGVNPCTIADVGADVYASDYKTIANNAARGPKVGILEAFAPAGQMPGAPCRVRVVMSR